MPEICEVCLTSQYLHTIIHGNIEHIIVLGGRYKKKPILGFNLLKFPLKIDAINTKGKFMWFTLSNDDNTDDEHKIYLMNTFGLTGKWSFEKLPNANIEFRISKKNKQYSLYFCDQRNFGTIEFTSDIAKLDNKLNKLADDLLQTDIPNNLFRERLSKFKNKTIVSVLMSQEKKSGIGSGLGNYLVPEILYRAKISPHRKIKTLSKSEIKLLHNAIKYQLRLCYIHNNTEYISHMSKFLSTHPNKIQQNIFPNYYDNISIDKSDIKSFFKVYRQKKDPDGFDVIGDHIISGRTTYWSPEVQK